MVLRRWGSQHEALADFSTIRSNERLNQISKFTFVLQISTNVQILTEAVLTRVTTLPVHSLVPVQVVWSWILANEDVKVNLPTCIYSKAGNN